MPPTIKWNMSNIIIFLSYKIKIMFTPSKYKKLYTFVSNLHLIY
jgi:hypothetical protein